VTGHRLLDDSLAANFAVDSAIVDFHSPDP
jgi:hypothetical protein